MQIMLVCERHNLYDAIIYIHNTAILDYISPAERMLTGLSTYVFYVYFFAWIYIMKNTLEGGGLIWNADWEKFKIKIEDPREKI